MATYMCPPCWRGDCDQCEDHGNVGDLACWCKSLEMDPRHAVQAEIVTAKRMTARAMHNYHEALDALREYED